MTSPMQLIQNRLREITIALKNAINNDLPYSDIQKLNSQYNKYYMALQLLDSHSEIEHRFSRLYITPQKKATYNIIKLKLHTKCIEQISKHENKIKNLQKVLIHEE